MTNKKTRVKSEVRTDPRQLQLTKDKQVAGVEARKRLAQNLDSNKANVIWVNDAWTEIRVSLEDGIKIEGRSLRYNAYSNVHADDPALTKLLLELAEESIGNTSDNCCMFWAEFRFSKMK